jgi:hypothetical protein
MTTLPYYGRKLMAIVALCVCHECKCKICTKPKISMQYIQPRKDFVTLSLRIEHITNNIDL